MPDKRKITAAEAISLLNDGDYIHTFRTATGMLLGCDWSRESIIEAITQFESTLELTGETARGMNHGIALLDNTGPLFIETDKERIDQFDPPDLPKPFCTGCNKPADEIEEYIEAAAESDMTVDEFVRDQEGTYNHENGHLLCTECYIKAGMPAVPHPGRWVAP